MSDLVQHSATFWLSPGQTGLARAIAERARLAVMGVGAPDPSRAEGLAGELGGEALRDLRHALSACRTHAFVILDPGDFATTHADADVLRDATERGVRVVSIEPMPASLVDLVTQAQVLGEAPAPGSTRQQWARFMPLTRRQTPLPEVLELLSGFGAVRSASIRVFGAPAEGSLAARLLDAMDLVLALVGEPETIDASLGHSTVGRAVHLAPGESLRGPPTLHGDFTANLRFAGGRSAALHVSDQAGPWSKRITLIGPAGRLQIDDHGFEWLDQHGQRLDGSRPTSERPDLATVVAQQLTQLMTTASADPGLPDYPRALALAQAALLSARTGEGESPMTITRMAGV